ncbi:hypothetical protein [Actinokineospora spheciospongiae]|uniref:hypothetical protein n=1 Tax=Actinokineospora spheciospongiae TaxID=909613 RepID=UPI000D82A02E|nr:hypothetical protein [Actinokineospora spheciospongiae]PWW63281.1 hypothetical protein DFQ13_104271 [Actinokineospora spheciospongiae]
MRRGRRRPRRTRTLGRTIAAVVALVAPLLSSASPAGAADIGTTAATDVYIRDHVGDTGVEPHSASVWTSPDVKVCPTSVECTTSQNPEVGSVNHIFVKLNNPGPRGSGADVGNLDVYRSTPGGGTGWSADWTSIGGVLGVSVAASGTTTVVIPWPDVPGPDLFARWREGGGRAAGLKQVGPTSFEVGDFKQARLFGVLLAPRTRPELKLQFGLGASVRKGSHVIRVTQFAPLGADQPSTALTDVGGVEYQVAIR